MLPGIEPGSFKPGKQYLSVIEVPSNSSSRSLVTMPVITSISLVLALVLAVTLGPQTRPWSWGPAFLMLGVSLFSAIPSLFKRNKGPGDLFFVIYAIILAAWFAFRTSTSPVPDLAESDLLLLVSAIGFCLSTRVIAGDPKASSIFFWGLALLLTSNLVVMGIQFHNPYHTPIFFNQDTPRPLLQGFFGYYNENANFLIGASMFVASGALFGRAPKSTRILWGLISLVGIMAVWFTRSRGGILAAAIAIAVFAVIALIMAKRQNKPWFAHGVVALPVVGILSILFLVGGWQSAQKERSQDVGMDHLMDNHFRLYMMSMAVEAISNQPLSGGGSRSFSWQSYQLWDEKAYGTGSAKPEMVHHELLQAATDYGLIGACLVFGLLAGCGISAFVKTAFEENATEPDTHHSWRLGGLSALAGMFVQSNFSFVFHLLPGVALLGICIAAVHRPSINATERKTLVTSLLLIAACAACLWICLPAAWKGTLVMRSLWHSHYGKEGIKTPNAKTEALDEAIQIWPRYEFYLERAMIFQQLAGSPDHPEFEDYANRAISSYQIAFRRHPYSPEIPINQANLLSMMGDLDEADTAYEKAISLQGKMETGFRAHFYYSLHLLRKSLTLRRNGNISDSITSAELAAEQIEEAVRLTPPWVIHLDGRNLRISIHENLGLAKEANGDRPGALAAYDFAASIQSGNRAHYRSAVLIGRMGRDEWAKRRAPQALHLFMKARDRLTLAGRELPEGVSPSQRLELADYLDRSIALLKAAKVEAQE